MVDSDTNTHRADAGGLPAMQLRMTVSAAEAAGLPDPAVPEGYELRPCRKDDEEGSCQPCFSDGLLAHAGHPWAAPRLALGVVDWPNVSL